MPDGSYIKLYRSLLDWEWYGNTNTKVLFLHMLLKANWKEGRFKGMVIPRGSFVSSLQKLAKETTLSVREVRTAINHLKMTGEVTSKSHNKCSVFTVVNYDVYQESDTQTDKRETSKRQTSDKQATTIEEGKKEKKGKKESKDNMSPEYEYKGARTEYPYKDVIDYLNQKVGTAYRATSKDSRKHIKARFDEGYTLDDFKAVIDKKITEWKDDPRMSPYLRPSTLFGSKFEGYLNQPQTQNRNPQNRFNNFEQRSYDYDDLERQLLQSQSRKGNISRTD